MLSGGTGVPPVRGRDRRDAGPTDSTGATRAGIRARPGRRYLLKALSLLPWRDLRRLALGCNPISWAMRRDAGRTTQPFDAVHATALPYTWPIACGLRLARRLRVPFLLTPFVHLGDLD